MEEQSKKLKILLIEDDKFVLSVYKDGLEEAGFEVTLALDGAEGIKKIREVKPDLVLLDLIMPVKDGFEVLKELRADDNIKDTPVIVLSNLGRHSDIGIAKDFGVIDYLVKVNFSMEEMIDRIKFHLAQIKSE